jgi:hypothetical protein
MHIYEVRPRRDKRGFDLISDTLPFGRLSYQDADAAVGYAQIYSRSHRGEVRVFDAAGAVAKDRKLGGGFQKISRPTSKAQLLNV